MTKKRIPVIDCSPPAVNAKRKVLGRKRCRLALMPPSYLRRCHCLGQGLELIMLTTGSQYRLYSTEKNCPCKYWPSGLKFNRTLASTASRGNTTRFSGNKDFYERNAFVVLMGFCSLYYWVILYLFRC